MLGGCNGEVDNGDDSMTVITYKDHCCSDLNPYEVTIYTDDGRILWKGETKQFTLESSVERANIKGGEGKPRAYPNVKSVEVSEEKVIVSYDEPEDEDWRDYLEWLSEGRNPKWNSDLVNVVIRN